MPHAGALFIPLPPAKVRGCRSWVGTRYYVGQGLQTADGRLYAEQQRFLARLAAADARITVHLGRLEPRMFVMLQPGSFSATSYDAAYLLSAGGDFTPAVAAARAAGKDVYAVSPTYGAQLASAATAFIRIDREWFQGCYRS